MSKVKKIEYFLLLEKRNKAKTHLRKLLTENSHEITEPKEILNNIEHFYSELYSQKNIKTHEDCSAFMTRIDSPTLTAEEKATCEGYLTANECFNALKTPLCNRPSGIFILAGFSGKNHWVGQIPTGSA